MVTADSLVQLAERYTNKEQELRELHGAEAWIGRIQVYQTDDGPMAICGWVDLGGAPAVFPEGLTGMVIAEATEPESGVMRTPAEVQEALAPYLSRSDSPLPHVVFRVPPEERESLLKKLRSHEPTNEPIDPVEAERMMRELEELRDRAQALSDQWQDRIDEGNRKSRRILLGLGLVLVAVVVTWLLVR